MNQDFFLPLNSGSPDLADLTTDIATITVTRASGETCAVDARQGQVDIADEHPQVDRMSGDWGAICEVFRQSSVYYLSISGVRLSAGDTVAITYQRKPIEVTMKVIDIENGRAQIDPPVIVPL